MTPAVKWVEEHSRAVGTTRLVLLVLATEAEQCIAMPGVLQLEQKAKVSRRTVFRALSWGMRHGEIEQLQRLKGFTGVFHFKKMGSATKKRSGSDKEVFDCPHLAAFRARYLGGDIRPYIRGTQQNLIEIPRHFEPAVPDEVLEFTDNEVRRKVGLPIALPREFRLEG